MPLPAKGNRSGGGIRPTRRPRSPGAARVRRLPRPPCRHKCRTRAGRRAGIVAPGARREPASVSSRRDAAAINDPHTQLAFAMVQRALICIGCVCIAAPHCREILAGFRQSRLSRSQDRLACRVAAQGRSALLPVRRRTSCANDQPSFPLRADPWRTRLASGQARLIGLAPALKCLWARSRPAGPQPPHASAPPGRPASRPAGLDGAWTTALLAGALHMAQRPGCRQLA